MVVLRQEHQQATGHADLGGQARALAANGVLDDLDHQGLAFVHALFDGHLHLGRARVHAGGTVFAVQVGHVQEGRPLQPDVDEGRLHAGQHAHDLAGVNVAHQATLQRALDVQFLHGPALDDGHAGFLGRPVDEDVL